MKRLIRHRNMSHIDCIEYTIREDVEKHHSILKALEGIEFETLDVRVKSVLKFRVVEGEITERFDTVMKTLGFEVVQTLNT